MHALISAEYWVSRSRIALSSLFSLIWSEASIQTRKSVCVCVLCVYACVCVSSLSKTGTECINVLLAAHTVWCHSSSKASSTGYIVRVARLVVTSTTSTDLPVSGSLFSFAVVRRSEGLWGGLASAGRFCPDGVQRHKHAGGREIRAQKYLGERRRRKTCFRLVLTERWEHLNYSSVTTGRSTGTEIRDSPLSKYWR